MVSFAWPATGFEICGVMKHRLLTHRILVFGAENIGRSLSWARLVKRQSFWSFRYFRIRIDTVRISLASRTRHSDRYIYIYIARSLRGNEVETYMEDSILEVSAVRDGTCTVDLWLSAGRLLSLSHLSIRRSCPTVMQHVSLLELKITYSKRFDEANTACCGTLCLAQEIGYSASTLFSRWNLHLRSHSARLRKGATVQGMKGEDSKN